LEGYCYPLNLTRTDIPRGYHLFPDIVPNSKVSIHQFSLLFAQYFYHSYEISMFQLYFFFDALNFYYIHFLLLSIEDCERFSVFCLGNALYDFYFWINYFFISSVYPFRCGLQYFHIFLVFSLYKFRFNCNVKLLKLS